LLYNSNNRLFYGSRNDDSEPQPIRGILLYQMVFNLVSTLNNFFHFVMSLSKLVIENCHWREKSVCSSKVSLFQILVEWVAISYWPWLLVGISFYSPHSMTLPAPALILTPNKQLITIWPRLVMFISTILCLLVETIL